MLYLPKKAGAQKTMPMSLKKDMSTKRGAAAQKSMSTTMTTTADAVMSTVMQKADA